MRIDVNLDPAAVDAELDALQLRLQRRGEALFCLGSAQPHRPQLVLRGREADGEYYVYVEDRDSGRLAGCTVFNRLIEVERRIDPHVRAPHSRFRATYQRQGLAGAIYRRALQAGLCLVSGARQSEGAHALWQALAREHASGYVGVRGKGLHWLGPAVARGLHDDLHTRRILLGRGWDVARLRSLGEGPAAGAAAAQADTRHGRGMLARLAA